jgi:hypothetical protein
MSDPVTLLDATLQEDAATDEALTELADAAVNQEAADPDVSEDAAESKSGSKGRRKAST